MIMMKYIKFVYTLVTLLLAVGCATNNSQAEKLAQEKLEDSQATERLIQEQLRESQVATDAAVSAAADKEKRDNLEREKKRQARIQEENRKKRESQESVKNHRENVVSQQQLAADQVYDREFRVFLRTRNYPNVSSIVASSRKYNNFWRDNPNASQDIINSFWNSLSESDQNDVRKIETPEFKELWSEFADNLAQKIAQQQYAQRQLALKSITENPIILSPNTVSRNSVIIINGGSDTNPNGYSRACGFKPFPQLGCQIGRCVNGVWEQICR